MEGVGGEQHAGQIQLGDHPLRRRDLVALDVDFAVRQQDRRLRGEGAQRLGRLAVVEVVEATSLLTQSIGGEFYKQLCAEEGY